MSSKDKQNNVTHSNIILFCLLMVIILLVFGISLKSAGNTTNRLRIASEQSTANGEILSEIQETLIQIQKQLDEIQENQSVQSETLKTIQDQLTTISESEVLTGPKLYASYADEITSTIYPDIPAEYVKALIWIESRYEPMIVNESTGVKGLMQISPRWHTQRAENLGVTDLFDPYGNILVGCDILNELTQQEDFNYALNFFAGGYPYADRYKDCISPYIQELNTVIHQMENGEIILGGE